MKNKLLSHDLKKMKEKGGKAVEITAYDYWTAEFAETAGMSVMGHIGLTPRASDSLVGLKPRDELPIKYWH